MPDVKDKRDVLLCFFVFLCCARSLPQACAAAGTKMMQRAWTVVCFYTFYLFFQTSGQKQHWSNLYLPGTPMTEPGQKLEILRNFMSNCNHQHKPVGRSQPGALPALYLVSVYLFCCSVSLPISWFYPWIVEWRIWWLTLHDPHLALFRFN